MRKKRRHIRPEPVVMRRVLGEANARENNFKGHGTGWYRCRLNLSELLGSLPMTVNQDDIQIEATFEKGCLNLMVYCDEWVTPDHPDGGVYAVESEEDEELRGR